MGAENITYPMAKCDFKRRVEYKKMSKTTIYGLFLYLSITGFYTVAMIRDLFFNKRTELYKSFGGRFKYLTILNLYVHYGYFIISSFLAMAELSMSKKNSKVFTKVKQFCNLVYTSIVFPVGLFVAITFWGIFIFDRELIFPKAVDHLIPIWQNHLLHTLPLVAPLLENFFTKHFYRDSFFIGVLPTLFLAGFYIIWVLIVSNVGGIWAYPILEVLSPTNRAIFFGVSLLFLGLLYQTGKMVNVILWPSEETTQSKRIKSKVKRKFN
ncbi:androgen-dependent TFPI-regulating -like isoform X1 [Brachionus plicatilis]|uniref:Androgen-dependent TFPI-regulating-like isoform X1 n=1 Tax=Brachionus plicatilis TaxID=10195 RepID=A0A3M7QJT4_BRAPC|nr:androgen-dependent TFPI-regulating -like isoform X1 [Brachionus plicatilis]